MSVLHTIGCCSYIKWSLVLDTNERWLLFHHTGKSGCSYYTQWSLLCAPPTTIFVQIKSKDFRRMRKAFILSQFLKTSTARFEPSVYFKKSSLTQIRNFTDCNCSFQKRKHKCTVFEIHRKSLIQHCERSELRLHFELIEIAKNRQFWQVFENTKLAVKQCYQTGQL